MRWQVKMTSAIRDLVNLLARQTHEVWARDKIEEGWKYAPDTYCMTKSTRGRSGPWGLHRAGRGVRGGDSWVEMWFRVGMWVRVVVVVVCVWGVFRR
jgi:hypothetical protein